MNISINKQSQIAGNIPITNEQLEKQCLSHLSLIVN